MLTKKLLLFSNSCAANNKYFFLKHINTTNLIKISNISTNENLKSIATVDNQTNTLGNLNSKNAKIHTENIDFENSEIAFKAKNNYELIRGLLVFQLCTLKFLVDNQNTIMNFSRKILGKKLFALLMKNTFYGHFVAGENQIDIKPTIDKMMKYGVKSILDYSVEDDLNSSNKITTQNETNQLIGKYGKFYHLTEHKFDKNMEVFIECIDSVFETTKASGLAAVKVTSLLRPSLLLKLNETILEFKKNKKQSLLEWKNLVNENFNLNTSLNQTFTQDEIGEIRNMAMRLNKIMNHATEKNVRVFVDAEQTYFQAAIRFLTIELMRHFNKNKCIVFNTYQNYLKSVNSELLEDLNLSHTENFYFGAKLVRGAYMEQERPRAKEHGYEDPINSTFEKTTEMYEKNLVVCMNEIKNREPGHVAIMVASHNESTVRFALEKMKEFDIKPTDRVICFGQLLGMCDYITFSLSAAGHSVYKYTPYGPVEEVLPYLSRRAVENRGIFEKVKKEKRLLATELKRRFANGQLF